MFYTETPWQWAEAALLQLGAGLPPAYGRIRTDRIYALLALHVYYRAVRDRPEIASRAARLLPRGASSARDPICAVAVTPSTWQINDRPFLIEQRGQSNLLAAALRDLEDSPAVHVAHGSPAVHVAHGSPAATFYVGHDTNLDGLGVLLNLSWAPEPYPRDATPPGAILRLSAAGDEIRADYMCAPTHVRIIPDLLETYYGLTADYT